MPLQEPEQPSLPPPGTLWLAAAVNGTLATVVFSLPLPPALLAPVPLMIAWRRYGRGVGLATAGVALVSAALLKGAAGYLAMGTADASAPVAPGMLAFVALVLAPALLLCWSLERQETAARALTAAAGMYLGLACVVLAAMELLSAGESLAIRGNEWIGKVLDAAIVSGKETARGDLNAMEAIGTLESRRQWYQHWATVLLPSLAASSAVLAMWVNVIYSRWFTGPRDKGDDLCRWQLPMWVMYLFMVCCAAVVVQVGPLAGILPRWEPALVVAANGLVLLVTLYWLQGAAVANYFFFRLRVGPITKVVGIGLQAVLMVRPVTSAMYAATGMADAWFDLRRLDEPVDDDNGEER